MEKLKQLSRTEKLALLKGLQKQDPSALQALQEWQHQIQLLTSLRVMIATVYMIWSHPELASFDPIDTYYLKGTSMSSRQYLVDRYNLDASYLTNGVSLAWPFTLTETVLEQIIEALICFNQTNSFDGHEKVRMHMLMLYETQGKLEQQNQMHLLTPYLDNPRFQQILQQYGSA